MIGGHAQRASARQPHPPTPPEHLPGRSALSPSCQRGPLPVSSASAARSPSGLQTSWNRPTSNGTASSGLLVLTLRHDPAQAVPQRPVRRPMGPDRTDSDGLEKGPTRPQAHRTAGESRPARRFQRDPLRQPHRNPWKYLPHDFPSHGTVYAYYAAWRDEGIFAQLNYDLTGLARVKKGRKPEPTASVIDTQSVKTSTNAPTTSQGTDAAKNIAGRKRGILTDTIGLILAVAVTAASPSENAVGIQLLDQAKKTYPSISKSWVDTGFKNAMVEHGAGLGIDVEVVHRKSDVPGFHVVKRRWVVERSLGWIMLRRPPRPRLRDPPGQLRSRDPHRLDRQPHQAHNGRKHTNLARNLLGHKGQSAHTKRPLRCAHVAEEAEACQSLIVSPIRHRHHRLGEQVPECPDHRIELVRGVLHLALTCERGHLLLQFGGLACRPDVVAPGLLVELRHRRRAGALTSGGVDDPPAGPTPTNSWP